MGSVLVSEPIRFREYDWRLTFATIVPYDQLHLMNMWMVSTCQVEWCVAKNLIRLILFGVARIYPMFLQDLHI